MSTLAQCLPDKALFSIFTYSSLPDANGGTGGELFRRYPFLFGHVCSRWRRVCFATPDIWTSIPTKCNHDFGLFDLTTAHTYLSYAGPTLPLTLCVYGSKDGSELREYRYVFEELVTKQATRWIEAEFFMFLQTNITGTLRGLTSLKTLSIVFPPEPPHALESADWLATLERCQKSVSITLPSLTNLSLDFQHCTNPAPAIAPVLELLTLPSLSSLTFLMNKECDYLGPAWRLLGKMLERSKDPPLKTFHTSPDSYPRERLEMEDFLEHIPHLERADTLYFDYPLWDLLDKRDPSSGKFKYAPSLREVRFSHLDFVNDYRTYELKLVLDERRQDGKGVLTHLLIGDSDEELCPIGEYEKMLDPENLWKVPLHIRGRWTFIERNSREISVPWDIYRTTPRGFPGLGWYHLDGKLVCSFLYEEGDLEKDYSSEEEDILEGWGIFEGEYVSQEDDAGEEEGAGDEEDAGEAEDAGGDEDV